jgi:hypothetical protein
VIVAAIYLLYMTSKIVWGELREPITGTTTARDAAAVDLNGPRDRDASPARGALPGVRALTPSSR